MFTGNSGVSLQDNSTMGQWACRVMQGHAEGQMLRRTSELRVCEDRVLLVVR